MKEFNSGGSVNYIVIACEEDIHLVTDVLRAKLGVFNSEFVLNAVTRCEMDFDLSRYLRRPRWKWTPPTSPRVT